MPTSVPQDSGDSNVVASTTTEEVEYNQVFETDYSKYTTLDVYHETSYTTICDYIHNTPYAKIVLQEDWLYSDGNFSILVYRNGKINRGTIIDLNGHVFCVTKGVMDLYMPYLEIWDSSAAETGEIRAAASVRMYRNNKLSNDEVVVTWLKGGTISGDVVLGAVTDDSSKVIQGSATALLRVSGGKISGNVSYGVHANNTTCKLLMEGGTISGGVSKYGAGASTSTIVPEVAPYIPCVYDAAGMPSNMRSYDAYAVSTTPYTTGAYNYVYGYAWELTAAELANLSIPTGKTYYLWGRDNDGWYHYLNLVYSDWTDNWAAT